MKLIPFALSCILLAPLALTAQNDVVKPEKLVGWMRTVNTFQWEYKMSNGRFGNETELMDYAKTAKPTGSAVAVAFAKELSSTSTHPYSLKVVTSPDGSHYLAAITSPSDMHDESSWCKTEVFSSDTGLISLGQNIQCSGVSALGASSKPLK